MNQSDELYALWDDDDDFISPLVWPDSFASKPAYALLRPLTEYTNPWRSSLEGIHKYLNSQAKRLGGRYYVSNYFIKLAEQVTDYPALHAFLTTPFEKHYISDVLPELELFLRQRFLTEEDETEDEKGTTSTDTYFTEIKGCFDPLIKERAIQECPLLLSNAYNEDFTTDIFSSPVAHLIINLEDSAYSIVNIPVVLGVHYINPRIQKRLTKKHTMHRVLECYARWDSASVLLYEKNITSVDAMHKEVEGCGFYFLGKERVITLDTKDYVVRLLIEKEFPAQSITVTDWDLNCPKLTIY